MNRRRRPRPRRGPAARCSRRCSRRRPSNGTAGNPAGRPRFDTPKFLAGAREAYAQIVNAFAAGDRDALRPLLSPDVFAAFDAGITARTAPPAALVKLHRRAHRPARRCMGGTRKSPSPSPPNSPAGTVTDVWTFERNLDSTDPNWVLVATSGDVPE